MGLLLGAAWLAAPSVIKSQIESQGSEALGRKLTVAAVDFKPWTLELTLTGLRIASADGKSDQFVVERLYADAAVQSVFRLAPVIDAITVDAPQVHISHSADGKFDFDDVLKRLAARPKDPHSSPVRFALYNVVVNNGSLDIADDVGKHERLHTVRHLHLAVPFLSNLDSSRDVTVQPHLGFELNGTSFDSAALATPFAQTAKGEVSLRINKLDLAPYLPYLPQDLPLALKAAVLDTDLKIAFEQTALPKVVVSGAVTVSHLQVARPDGAALLSVGVIHTVLKDVRPLEHRVVLESVEVSRLALHASRDSSGNLNLDLVSKSKDAKVQDVKATTSTTEQSAWRVELEHFKFKDGEILWADQMAASPVRWRLGNVDVTAKDVHWPATSQAGADQKAPLPMQFDGHAFLEAMGATKPDAKLAANTAGAKPTIANAAGKVARVAFKGQYDDKSGKVDVQLGGLALRLFAPYVAQYLVTRVDGVFSADATATWGEGGVKLALQSALLEKFAMTVDQSGAASSAVGAKAVDPKAINPKELPAFDALEVSDTSIDLGTKTVNVGKIALRKPVARVAREEDASWMFARWMKQVPQGTSGASVPAQAAGGPAAPWSIGLADVSIDDGTLTLVDRVPVKRVFIEMSALKAHAAGLTSDGKKPAPLSLSAKVRSGRTDPGTLSFAGTAMWSPVVAQGQLEVRQLPLHVAAPYFADRFNIELQRADANFKGQVRYAAMPDGPSVQVKGDASLDDLRANSVLAVQKGSGGEPTIEELLNWKSLAVPGLDMTLTPGEPMRLKLREAVLSDFFARLIIDAEGRLVLQDLVKPQDVGPPSALAKPEAPAPVIDVGSVTIINGRVAFSDRFIKPNYSADLSVLNGKLGRFSSQSPDGSVQMADLELKGRAEGTAGLEIAGKVNPLAKPLALDVHGKVRDLELSPLSSYAIKYAGYGIERGKLSVDVNYAIQPDGQLTATNNIVLSQLTFGEKVEGGASLPVKLAVALLSDSNGVIELNLPISGSINDPAFQIWPIVSKVIGNLFAKVLTSPFSLFSGGSGEEEDLANIVFVPGTTVIAPDAIAALDKALKVLIDKPSLKTTIVGTASLQAERDAIKLDRLNGLMLAEKRRIAGATGKDVAAVSSIADTEYAAILKEVYRRSDFKKPRNAIGMVKDLSADEMRAFLLENLKVSEDDVDELARARGVVVREYLTAHQLPSERIFLGEEDVAPTAPNWKPQAELSVILD
jgi:uncharacterized protein involved in outer membrane biogenesis